jgi:hypothetical protein
MVAARWSKVGEGRTDDKTARSANRHAASNGKRASDKPRQMQQLQTITHIPHSTGNDRSTAPFSSAWKSRSTPSSVVAF